MRAGGGYVGVHAAAETEPDWAFYRGLRRHRGRRRRLRRSPAAPSTSPTARTRRPRRCRGSSPLTEEWYNFAANVRGASHVLATVDERRTPAARWASTTRSPGARTTRAAGPGTPGSATPSSRTATAAFRKHLLGGIQWAAGVVEGDCGATVLGNYEKVTLNDEPGEPMSLAVLPDGRVLHNTRGGQIRLYDPATGASPVITTVPVYQHDEDGLQSVAIDPDFATNQWVYLYYAPPLNTPVDNPATPGVNEGDAPVDQHRPDGVGRRSRATTSCPGSSSSRRPTPHLDMATEQQILRVDVDRGICCHVAGEVKFDGKGLLYLVTGDDTNAGGSDGFTPINESPTQGPGYDAQRSAGQHQRPARQAAAHQGHGRTARTAIPAGNLFPESAGPRRQDPSGDLPDGPAQPVPVRRGRRAAWSTSATTRPTRGCPTRPADRRAPAAGSPPTRPGNYGWPYCYSPSLPYIDFDFVTRTSGAAVQLRRAGQRLAAQHRPHACCRRCSSRSSGTPTRRAPRAPARTWPNPPTRLRLQVAGDRHRWRRPDGRADLRLRRRLGLGDEVPGVLRRRRRLRRVHPGQDVHDADRRPGQAGRRRAVPARASSSTTRWTWSSARTAASTCWSTATASSGPTRTRSWR